MLKQWLERAVARDPAAPALIAGQTAETYASLRDKALGLASDLTARGMKAGAVLAVAERSPLALAMTSWGVAHCGALLPLNPAWPEPRQNAMKRLAGTVAQAASIALVIPTSGSAGEPRGVMLSHANLAASVKASRSRIPLEPGDVWQICLPLYHIGGQAILYRCAEAGACVLLSDNAERFDATSVLANMHRHAVTHVSLVPAMLARLLEAGAPPPSLKFVLIGGGALSASLAQRAAQAGWPVCPSYGMSEMASQVATLNPLPDDWQPGLVGAPLPGVEVAIVDGRICLRGEMLMAGYLGGSPHEGWLKTGDLGRIDEQGRLWVLGRADDMLVSGGINIHPQEVESLLSIFPGLRDAAVTALPDEIWGDRLAALVVGADASQMQSWCDHHLPSHLRPRRVFSVSELPRNAMGKLERRLLPKIAQDMVQDLAREMAGIPAEAS